MSGRPYTRRSGVGSLVVGLVLIVVGGYYVFRNVFGLALPELDSDQVVPLLAVILGLVLILRVWEDRAPHGRDEGRTA